MRIKLGLLLLIPVIFLPVGLVSVGRGLESKDDQKQASSLTVLNEAGKTTAMTAEDFAKLPRQTLKVKDRTGAAVVYEGVSLAEVLRSAGVVLGKELKGPLLANALLVEATDGYR